MPDPQAGIELGGKDFWFDPLTHEFGLEAGGAQYGMSYDNYGRRFGASNSDHLQLWVYDERYARNPFFTPPPARQSIAADGGAAEVFRISPDEPWRIIRTRWRIGGVVRGVVEARRIETTVASEMFRRIVPLIDPPVTGAGFPLCPFGKHA